jgi:hypothetical protein
MRMVQSRNGSCLVLESSAETLGGNLDRDFTAEAGVTRAVDFAHAAASQLPQDFVGAKASRLRRTGVRYL